MIAPSPQESDETLWYTQVFALTGNIGCGKSTVAGLLKGLGAEIIDADDLSHQAVGPGSPALVELVRVFGADIIDSDGNLKRAELGKIVFENRDSRRKLEAILHPMIRALGNKAFHEIQASESKVVIYDVPLFYEAGLDKFTFAGAIVVYAPREVCIERAIARRKTERVEIEKRLNQQLDPQEQKRRADFVIDNGGTKADLREPVQQLFTRLKARRGL